MHAGRPDPGPAVGPSLRTFLVVWAGQLVTTLMAAVGSAHPRIRHLETEIPDQITAGSPAEVA
jgi:hypothetical protein